MALDKPKLIKIGSVRDIKLLQLSVGSKRIQRGMAELGNSSQVCHLNCLKTSSTRHATTEQGKGWGFSVHPVPAQVLLWEHLMQEFLHF